MNSWIVVILTYKNLILHLVKVFDWHSSGSCSNLLNRTHLQNAFRYIQPQYTIRFTPPVSSQRRNKIIKPLLTPTPHCSRISDTVYDDLEAIYILSILQLVDSYHQSSTWWHPGSLRSDIEIKHKEYFSGNFHINKLIRFTEDNHSVCLRPGKSSVAISIKIPIH